MVAIGLKGSDNLHQPKMNWFSIWSSYRLWWWEREGRASSYGSSFLLSVTHDGGKVCKCGGYGTIAVERSLRW